MNKLWHISLLILLVCYTIFLSVYHILSSDYLQKYSINFMEKILTENVGYQIKLEEVRISFPFKIQINSLSISDNKREWLRAKGVKMKLSPLYLLTDRQIIVSSLSAGEVNWLYKPNYPGVPNNKSNSDATLVLQKINFPNIIINKEIILISEDLKLSLRGGLKYSENKLQFNISSEILNDFNQFLIALKVESRGYFNTKYKFLDIEKFNINSDLYNIQGFSSIDIKSNLVKGTYNIFCSQLNRIVPELKGALKSEINFFGSLQKPLFIGKIETSDLEYEKLSFPNLTLTTKLEYDFNQQVGNFEMKEEGGMGALSISFKDQNDIVKLEQIKVVQGSNTVVGHLNYIQKYGTLNGSLNLKSTNFEVLSNLINLSINAEANMLLNFTSDRSTQRMNIDGDFSNLSIEEFGASNLQVKANVSDVWNLKSHETNILIQDARYKNDTLLKRINLKTHSKYNKIDFILQIDGKSDKSLKLVTLGNILIDSKEKFDLNITKTFGAYNKYKINSQAITVKYKDQKLQYDVPVISFDKGKIIAYGWIDNRNISSRILFKTLPLLLPDHNPLEFAKATLDSEIKIGGEVSCPKIEAKLDISNINLIPQEASNYALYIKYKDNNLQINSSIENSNLMQGHLKLTIPLQLSLLPYKLEIEKTKEIAGNLIVNLRIDTLAAILFPPVHRFKGKLITDIKIVGSFNNPQVFGLGYVKEGKYENLLTGIKIENIHSIIEGKGKKIELKEFKAYDDKEKSISAIGQLVLNKKNMPFNFDITSNGFYFLRHPYVHASAGADIKITGDISKVKIEGLIEPTLVEIQIPDQFEEDLPSLNITKVIDSTKKEEQQNGKELFGWDNIGLDISINAKHKIFIRGWGVDAELGGELKCTSYADAPEIKGKLETIRGRYQEFGKQLTIRQGSVVFNGPIPPSPYLNIVGFSNQDNVEVRLILSGSLLKPSLSIESSPSLTQEEALSILLFGKQSAHISPFQGLQLADSLRRLLGYGDSINMFGNTRRLIKVDDIKIKNSSNNPRDAALGVGKYLTDKVYLEIEKGIQAGSGKTRIEVEVKNNLSIESSIGENGSNNIGINWRRDY